MDITVRAERIEIKPDANPRMIKITLTDIDEYNTLDEIGMDNAVLYYGIEEVLECIGMEDIRDYMSRQEVV